jgi:hypothetical protein
MQLAIYFLFDSHHAVFLLASLFCSFITYICAVFFFGLRLFARCACITSNGDIELRMLQPCAYACLYVQCGFQKLIRMHTCIPVPRLSLLCVFMYANARTPESSPARARISMRFLVFPHAQHTNTNPNQHPNLNQMIQIIKTTLKNQYVLRLQLFRDRRPGTRHIRM